MAVEKLFTVCTELVRSPYIEHAASGLPNPTRLEGGGTIYPISRPAGVTTHSLRIACPGTVLMGN